MSIKNLIQLKRDEFECKDTMLRVKSAVVSSFDDALNAHVDDLLDTLKSHKIAVGLAAPQIGVALRISVINISKGKREPSLILVNPQIVESGRQTDCKPESCMSLPHFRGPVERPLKVHISYQDRLGKQQSLRAEGFLARVICHEVDHLDRILYVDRMDSLSKLESVDLFKDD